MSVLHYIPVRPDLYLGFRGVVAGTFRDVQHAMNRSPDSLGHSTHHLLDMVRFSEDFE